MTWHKSEMVTYPNTVIPSIIVTKIAQKEVFRVSNIDYMYHKHDQKPKNDSRVAALDVFFQLREVPGLKKKPSTSELIDWIKLLLADNIPLELLQSKDIKEAIPPLYGALLKNEQDVDLIQRLAFMMRR